MTEVWLLWDNFFSNPRVVKRDLCHKFEFLASKQLLIAYIQLQIKASYNYQSFSTGETSKTGLVFFFKEIFDMKISLLHRISTNLFVKNLNNEYIE